jgi:hypothetical protein
LYKINFTNREGRQHTNDSPSRSVREACESVPGGGGKAAATTGWSTGRTRARQTSTWSPVVRHSTGAEGSTSALGMGTQSETASPVSEKERMRRARILTIIRPPTHVPGRLEDLTLVSVDLKSLKNVEHYFIFTI